MFNQNKQYIDKFEMLIISYLVCHAIDIKMTPVMYHLANSTTAT